MYSYRQVYQDVSSVVVERLGNLSTENGNNISSGNSGFGTDVIHAKRGHILSWDSMTW